MTRIAAVVFDMYGTLTPSLPAAAWAGQKRVAAVPLGIPEGEWLQAYDATWGQLVGTFGDMRGTFQAVAARLGRTASDDQFDRAVAARYEAFKDALRLRPDAVTTLRALRASSLRTALLSDCTFELSDQWLELELSRYFDTAVFSCVEHRRKPDPRLFLAAAERLGVAPEQCLYVGDGGGDELAGAARVGMYPVLLKAPDWQTHLAPGRPEQPWTGRVAVALSEIPGIIGGLHAA
jgi:putative hydrolase of the HAD superfamily